MTEIKQWLNRARNIDAEITALKSEQEKAFTAAVSVVNTANNEKIQTTRQNTAEAKFAAYAEYSVMIDKRINELYSVKAEILNAVNAVEDDTLRNLLELRYLQGETWDTIAQTMHYSYVHVVHNLNPRALKAVENKIME